MRERKLRHLVRVLDVQTRTRILFDRPGSGTTGAGLCAIDVDWRAMRVHVVRERSRKYFPEPALASRLINCDVDVAFPREKRLGHRLVRQEAR